MSDQLLPDQPLPFDSDADNGQATKGPFLYIGKGLTASEFTSYVQSYNFGQIPPDFIVLHHTAIPSTQQAHYPNPGVWDANEAGMNDGQIYNHRLNELNGIKNYYATQLGWDRGPHLMIDDRYIWLFTPMYNEGIHAKWGNQF